MAHGPIGSVEPESWVQSNNRPTGCFEETTPLIPIVSTVINSYFHENKRFVRASDSFSKKVRQHHTDSQGKCVSIIQTLKESASTSHRLSKKVRQHHTDSQRKCISITQTLKESASASYRRSKKVRQHHTDSQRKCVNIIQTLKESASTSYRLSKKVRQSAVLLLLLVL